MRKNKIKTIVFASDNKITDDAYEFIKEVFGIKAVLITNGSILEDFMDFEIETNSRRNERERFLELVANKTGIVISEILSGETRIWKLVELIKEKRIRKVLQQKQRIIS